MYTVGVRDHIRVTHSSGGEAFGAAPRLHGAAFTVSVDLAREEITDAGVVIEVATLRRELRGVLDDLDDRNLDDHPAFRGRRATPELIARHVHRELGRRLPINAAASLSITLEESPSAWARYAAPLRAGHDAPPPVPD